MADGRNATQATLLNRGDAQRSVVISNLPPTSDIVALDGVTDQVNTLTFSGPIMDRVLLIVSLGGPGPPQSPSLNNPFMF